MCTIAILFDVTEYPLVLAANRDEQYTRPTRPPELLAPGIVGGVDELSGGTWLAIDTRGRFAAVTNQADARPSTPVRSRGLVVRELALAVDPDAYVAALEPREYASMNLAWGDSTHVRVAYLRHDGGKETVELGSGVHVLCNDRLGSPGFPRAERFVRAIERHLPESWTSLSHVLRTALADHTEAIAGVPLSATCIHTTHYGTRSATIAALAPGAVVHYQHAEGPPCTAPFVDRLDLFADGRQL
jgi:uncharacterized protein with NRDE domain